MWMEYVEINRLVLRWCAGLVLHKQMKAKEFFSRQHADAYGNLWHFNSDHASVFHALGVTHTFLQINLKNNYVFFLFSCKF